MAVEQIQDHAYTGLLHPEALCEHFYSGAVPAHQCQRPMGQHQDMTSGQVRLEPHSWFGPASEGGSNEPCHRDGCGRLRLAKVHAGYKPEFIEVLPVTEELPYDTEPPVVNGFKPASEAVLVFNAYSEAVLGLVRRKDEAYGGAWRKQGYMGNLARILSKTARIQNMMWRDPSDEEWGTGTAFDESILDTLKDLMALCAFMGANIEDGNRWGRG